MKTVQNYTNTIIIILIVNSLEKYSNLTKSPLKKSRDLESIFFIDI
jgi:hypothetical protein